MPEIRRPPKQKEFTLKISILLLIAPIAFSASTKKVPHPVHVNSAPVDSLVSSLPGVGPEIAERIVAKRPFRTCDDVTENVKGLGEKRMTKICPLLMF